MKQIPPPIQEKHRYLKFEINGERKDIGEVVDGVWSSALKYMGTSGAGEAEIWIMGNKFDEKKQKGIIKVNNSKVDDLRAALVLNNGFDDDTFLSIEDVSGSLAGIED